VGTVAYIRSPRDLPAVIAEVPDTEMHAVAAAGFEKNESFRHDILALLEKDGPLLSRDIADRRAGTLVVSAIHEDVRFIKAKTAAVHHEIEDLATWLGLQVAAA
jgi:uncharacterized protein YcaQ